MFASCSKIVREGNAVKSVRRSDQMRKRKFVETMSLQAQKAAVRRNIRARLRSVLPAEVARQSAIVAATVLQSPQYAVAKSISVYIAKEGAAEVDTRLIIADALRTSRTCYIPRCISRTRMQMVRLASLEDLDNLPVNKMGIKEPELDENRLLALYGPEAPIDLIIMPGLAFDSNGM
ncbi:hypothetical protein HDU82_000784 [Entophlyctis luteolus]|nr:hypothetical protein HDU82_000784 [Entophlyctis luteolus]